MSYYVYHMEADLYKPGFLIYTDKHSLKTTDGKLLEIIAGNTNQHGYKEGAAGEARFYYIQGFTQISNSTILVSSTNEGCIRQIDRVTGMTSVFVGQCQSTGYQDGKRSIAKFYYPKAMSVDIIDPNRLLVMDYWNGAIRTVEINTGEVSTLFKEKTLNPFKRFVQDDVTGDLIFIAQEPQQSLFRLSYNGTDLTTLVARSSYGGNTDGDFSVTKFKSPQGIAKLDSDAILITDSYNDNIRTIDLKQNKSGTLRFCGSCGSIDSPFSVYCMKDSLYIGQYRKILKFKLVGAVSMSTQTPQSISSDIHTAIQSKPTTSIWPKKSTVLPTSSAARKQSTSTAERTTIKNTYTVGKSSNLATKPTSTENVSLSTIKKEFQKSTTSLTSKLTLTQTLMPMSASSSLLSSSNTSSTRSVSTPEGKILQKTSTIMLYHSSSTPVTTRLTTSTITNSSASRKPSSKSSSITSLPTQITSTMIESTTNSSTTASKHTETSTTKSPQNKPFDFNLRRRLQFRAVYDIGCAVLSDPLVSSTLSSVTERNFFKIKQICQISEY